MSVVGIHRVLVVRVVQVAHRIPRLVADIRHILIVRVIRVVRRILLHHLYLLVQVEASRRLRIQNGSFPVVVYYLVA
jgi:hypothetical protein